MSDHLAIDLYSGDGNFDLDKLAAADALPSGSKWCLVAIKLGQGNYYTGSPWAETMWPKARSCWGDRYGKTGFRVGYQYLDVAIDGLTQGEFFLKRMDQCGGIGYGDPFVMLDVERSGQRRSFSNQQIIDCASRFVQHVHTSLGLRIVAYAGEYLRERGIKIADFGCELAWVADYEATLTPSHYTLLGVDLEHLFGWQYCGVESAGKVDAHLKGYPWTTPAGPADISALTISGGGDAAISTLASWCVQPA